MTQRYKRFVNKAGRVGLVDSREFDLDAYLTRKALDGLYFMINEPVARTTALLRRVFR